MSTSLVEFQKIVWSFYREQGRDGLPWRKDLRPYSIVVSELMLQQTQVQRVVPKYQTFLKQWGSTKALAEASLADVLISWQGLGYNSRAKRLWECAQRVHSERRGRWPADYESLLALPGIGPYTAAAVMAFAYNTPVPLIETNVRTVYLHHFFSKQPKVSDAELLALVSETMATDNPREWYWALMDYGSYLKQTLPSNLHQSAQYKKQSRFKGSDREVRGAIIRVLTQSPVAEAGLEAELKQFSATKIKQQLEKLIAEELVVRVGDTYSLPH